MLVAAERARFEVQYGPAAFHHFDAGAASVKTDRRSLRSAETTNEGIDW
jgi:hypothetical protein